MADYHTCSRQGADELVADRARGRVVKPKDRTNSVRNYLFNKT